MRLGTMAKVGAMLLLGSLLVTGQDSLADAARRAKQKQGAKPKPTVYTEENLPQGTISVVGAPTPPPAAPGAAGAQPGTVKPGAGATEPPSEEYKDAEERLNILKEDYQHMVRRYDDIERRMREAKEEKMRVMYADSLSRRDEVLATKRKEIEDLQKEVDALAPKAKGKKPAKPAPAAEQPPPQ